MKQYLDHSIQVLSDPPSSCELNRTEIYSIFRFGHQSEYDFSDGFPILTTKRVPWKIIAHELIWFMRGDTNIKYLVDNDVHIWDGNAFQYYLKKQGIGIELYSAKWFSEIDKFIKNIKEDAAFAREHGNLGDVYGAQWRKWKTAEGKEIDQLGNLIKDLKENPTSRRMIVSAWNPGEIGGMALPPCHVMYHANVSDGKLNLMLTQRSADMFLGVPFNIASYSLLTQILAQETGYELGKFIHSIADAHFYCGADERGRWYKENLERLKNKIKEVSEKKDFLEIKSWIDNTAPAETFGKEGQDHVTAILEQLSREPKSLPRMIIAKKPFEELTIEDFILEGYSPHPTIKRSMAV